MPHGVIVASAGLGSAAKLFWVLMRVKFAVGARTAKLSKLQPLDLDGGSSFGKRTNVRFR